MILVLTVNERCYWIVLQNTHVFQTNYDAEEKCSSTARHVKSKDICKLARILAGGNRSLVFFLLIHCSALREKILYASIIPETRYKKCTGRKTSVK